MTPAAECAKDSRNVDVVLVLSDGISLGASECGVDEALHEHSFEPD